MSIRNVNLSPGVVLRVKIGGKVVARIGYKHLDPKDNSTTVLIGFDSHQLHGLFFFDRRVDRELNIMEEQP